MTANSRRVAALGLACALTALAAGCSTSGENRPSASAAGLPADCAPDRLATVREGKLTIGTDDPALEPWFSGNDPSNGAGFESAVGYRIAVALGYHPHHVVWRRLPFRTIIAAGQKPFDLALDEVTIRPERARNVDFSTPYFQVTQAVLVRRGSAFVDAGSLAALRDARLGALAGTTSYAAIGAQIEPSAAPTGFASMAQAIQALRDERVDGIVTDLPTAFELSRGPVAGSKVLGQLPVTGSTERFGVVLPKGSTVTGCVNRAVAGLVADGTIERLRQEWTVTRAPELR